MTKTAERAAFVFNNLTEKSMKVYECTNPDCGFSLMTSGNLKGEEELLDSPDFVCTQCGSKLSKYEMEEPSDVDDEGDDDDSAGVQTL